MLHLLINLTPDFTQKYPISHPSCTSQVVLSGLQNSNWPRLMKVDLKKKKKVGRRYYNIYESTGYLWGTLHQAGSLELLASGAKGSVLGLGSGKNGKSRPFLPAYLQLQCTSLTIQKEGGERKKHIQQTNSQNPQQSYPIGCKKCIT